jgi:23S rRNA (pseudouridine1915-N3)-methyltransferase
MKLYLVGVGRLRPAFREACDDYLRRLGRKVNVEEREVREAGQSLAPTERRDEEARRILARIPAGTAITLLDPRGSPWSSEQLATRLDSWRLAARDRALVIGGADGLGDAMLRAADEHWSLGPLTLPHELVRVIVTEQLYRAGTILQGHPYHRGTG